MKKRFLTFILTIATMLMCIFGFSACGGENPPASSSVPAIGGSSSSGGSGDSSSNNGGNSSSNNGGNSSSNNGGNSGSSSSGVGSSSDGEIFDTITPEMEDELAGFYYIFTNNACVITGIKDETVTEIVIPDFVTTIATRAFKGCKNLTSVTIPKSVKVIGLGAFGGCYSITDVYITDVAACCNIVGWGEFMRITPSDKRLYVNNELVTELIIPDSVERIDDYAFYGFSNLTSVVIGNGVKSIGAWAFEYCLNLQTVAIPDAAITIIPTAFISCDSLNYNVKDGLKYLGNSNNPYVYLANIENTEITTATIDSGCKIVSVSFSECANLTYYTKDGLKYLGNDDNPCMYLAGVENTEITTATIDSNCKFIGDSAFYDCDSLTSVVIPDGVTSIASKAFYNCDGLTSVVIPDSVTSIGSYAFNCCSCLTSVNIGDGVTTIGSEAFWDCSNLADVYITDIEAWCNITFMRSNRVGDYFSAMENPLYYAKNLYVNNELVTELIIPDGVTSISRAAFFGCSGLTSVVIPDSVAFIHAGAFACCDNLTSVVIGDGVMAIGDSAFYGCYSLTGVYITDIEAWCNILFEPDSDYYSMLFNGYCRANPLSYAKNLYVNNELITELIIPDDVTTIGPYTFNNCTSLTSVIIPDSATSIGPYTFSGCDSLTSVVIGDSVTSIGDRAFYWCENLTSIKYRGTQEEWNAISKFSSWNDKTGDYTITYNYQD